MLGIVGLRELARRRRRRAGAAAAADDRPGAPRPPSAEREPERGRSPTPRPLAAGSGRGGHPERRAERRRSRSGRSTCRRPSTSTSRTRSPASRRRTRASRSTGKTTRRTFQDDLNNAFAAGNAPDVINLSVSEGWVTEYAGKGLLLGARRQGPAGRQGHLLPGPVEGAAHRRQELPVPVVPGHQRRADQQGASIDKAGVDRRPTSRRPSTACRPCARPSWTRPARVCDIRLTVNDLLAQMVYEGNVKVISDDGKTFTFNSPEARRVAADVRRHGQGRHRRQHRPDHHRRPRRPRCLLGRARRRSTQTGPNLVRDVKANNADPVRQPGHRARPRSASPASPARA